MLKGKEQVKRACMLDTHVYINPWKVICRYTNLSPHNKLPIPPFPASPPHNRTQFPRNRHPVTPGMPHNAQWNGLSAHLFALRQICDL